MKNNQHMIARNFMYRYPDRDAILLRPHYLRRLSEISNKVERKCSGFWKYLRKSIENVRDFGNLGENMTGKTLILSRGEKSRRDDTLLTGGFNRRMLGNTRPLLSPARTTLAISAKYRPCGTWIPRAISAVRRLKPTVNQVSSLRDFLRGCRTCKNLIFTSFQKQNNLSFMVL